MITIILFLLSIGVQFTAAIYALLLVRVTGRKTAWILISVAMVLMTWRRVVSFASLVTTGKTMVFDLPEVISLVISFLLLLGVLGIRGYFRSLTSAETDRSAGRRQLQSIIDNSTAVIYVKDVDGRYLLINRRYEELFHVTREAIVGKTDHDLFPKERADAFREFDQRVLFAGTALESEETVSHDDGLHTYISVKAPLYDENGKPYAVCGISTDITGRKRAEQRLAAQYAVARALAESATLADAAPRLLQVICENLGWELGELWSIDRGANLLRCTETWHAPSISATEFIAYCRLNGFAPGVGLPGRVWQSGRPVWIADVTTDANFPRAAMAGKAGLHSAFAFPVKLGSEILGVMAFFVREMRRPDEDLINTLSTTASQIGQFIERKQAEEALRESQELYRLLTDSSNDLIALTDFQGRVVFISPSVRTMMGLDPARVIGANAMDFVHPEDAPSSRESLAHALAGETATFIHRGRHADGTWRWLDGWGQVVQFQGKPHVLIVTRDITERKRAEALRDGQKRILEMIATDAPLTDVLTSLVLLIESQSEGMLSSVLLLDDDGVHMRHGAAPSLPEAYWKAVDGASIGQRAGSCGTAMYRREPVIVTDILRDPLWADYPDLAALASPLRACWSTPIISHQGTVLGSFAMYYREEQGPGPAETQLIDIGVNIAGIAIERKRAEEALREAHEELEQRVVERTRELSEANMKLKELDRLKSLFIASMSHELRTPLNSVIGFSSILVNEWMGPLNEEQKENLSAILRSGKHLLALINDVIDVSKIEAGKVETVVEDFELSELLSEAVTTFARDLKEKGLTLEVEAVHQQMRTDRRRLLQCVLNLVSNAVKFTEKGNVRVAARRVGSLEFGAASSVQQRVYSALRTPNSALDGDFIEISVADTGIGIREEDILKLYQPFVRLVSAPTASIPGTGLGLYLTRKLVTQVLKGDIICISRYGEGSAFTIRMPIKIGG